MMGLMSSAGADSCQVFLLYCKGQMPAMYTLLIVHCEKHNITIKTRFVMVHYMTEKSDHLLPIIPATDVFPVPWFPLNTITGLCIWFFRLR